MSETRRNNYWRIVQTILSILVTVGLLFYLIWKFSPSKIIAVLSHLTFWYVFFTFALMIVMFCFKILRWQYILRSMDIKLPWYKTLQLILIGMFGASITPSKVGDLIRSFYLTQWTGRHESDTFFSAILDRIMDLVSIAIFAGIAFPFFLKPLNSTIKWGISLGLGIIGLLTMLLLNSKIVRTVLFLFSKLKKNKVQNKSDSKVTTIINSYYDNLSYFNKRKYLTIFIFSLCFWFLLGFQASVLLVGMNSFGLTLQINLVMTGITALATVVALAPISISGVGIRDATTMLLIVYSLDVLPEIALSISFIQTILNVFFPGLIGGIILLFMRKRQPKTQLVE